MKIDIFDFMVWAFVALITIMAMVEIGSWVRRTVRSELEQRRLLKKGIEPVVLPKLNAGFRLGGRSGAASRHFSREKEVGLLGHLGWGQTSHRNPDPDTSSRRYRQED